MNMIDKATKSRTVTKVTHYKVDNQTWHVCFTYANGKMDTIAECPSEAKAELIANVLELQLLMEG